MSGETKIKSMGFLTRGRVRFRVWAPLMHSECPSSDRFNDWDGGKHPMKPRRTATGTPTWPRLMSAISTGTLLTTAKGEFKRSS
jgi:1,4-alpha-glucan branching enzyme